MTSIPHAERCVIDEQRPRPGRASSSTTRGTPLEQDASGARASALALVELAKPAITRLVIVTMACGAMIAPGGVHLQTLVVALLGTALVVASANALNMVLERDVDALMERTRLRPIPSGRLSTEVALGFGIALLLVGLPLLYFVVNPLTAALALLAHLSYVLVYTPLKRVTPLALHVGAVPGALPPVIGWASMTGTLTWESWVPFAILFAWQLPHFLAITVFRVGDYERAGLRVLPAVRGLDWTKRSIGLYSLLLVVVSVVPFVTGQAGAGYGIVAVLSGGAFLLAAARGVLARRPERADDERWAKQLFFASLPYLVVVFGAFVASASLGI